MSKLSTYEVELRMARALERNQATAFWRYYFELQVRRLKEAAQ